MRLAGLVVEDNEGARNFAVSVLEDLGYRVIEAADADQALQHICEEPALGLIFTDVVLPAGFSGRMLADRVREMRPTLPVLYTTGYTRNAIVHNGILDRGVQLLTSPTLKRSWPENFAKYWTRQWNNLSKRNYRAIHNVYPALPPNGHTIILQSLSLAKTIPPATRFHGYRKS